MLSAILHGKKTGTGFAGVRLKIGETQGAEDVLTASVFERIAYLPDDVFQQFIHILFNHETEISALQEIEFWTAWMLNGGKVEPDVVLITVDGQTIIVEAKRYDFSQQQYSEQLANEIMAAYDNEITFPILLTVGGLNNYTQITRQNLKNSIDNILKNKNYFIEYQLYCVSWQQIYLALDKAIQMHNGQYLQRLLSDIRQAYDWHGIRYQPYRWLDKLKQYSIVYTTMLPILNHQNDWVTLRPINLNYHEFPSFLGN